MNKKKQKILFFYAKAGGGHLSGSNNLAKIMNKNWSKNVETKLVDGLEKSPKFVQNIFTDGYSKMINQHPLLFSIIYFLGKSKTLSKLFLSSLLKPFVIKHFEETIKKEQPDKIVTTYYWPPIIQKTLKKLKLDIPIYTVVTDNFTPPNIWFTQKENNTYLVLSDRAKKEAQKNGINREKIEVFEGFVDTKFNKPMNQGKILEFKQKVGITNELPTILITGGGPGLPNSKKIIKELIKINLKTNIIVVCGKNKTLKKELEELTENCKTIKILGFVDYIYELTNIADVVISKSGPASVIETLLLKKPLILTHYIWEQEKGNMEYVVQNKAGYYITYPKKIAQKTKQIINNKAIMKRLKNNITKLELKNEIEKSAEFIIKRQ